MQQTAEATATGRLAPRFLSPSRNWSVSVENYFTFHGPAPSLLLPTGGVDLLFVNSTTGIQSLPPFMIHGYVAEALAPPRGTHVSGIGIRFRPGGFTALTGIPQHEVTGGLFNFSEMIQRGLRLRLQRIASTQWQACGSSPAAMERVVEEMASKAAIVPSWLRGLCSAAPGRAASGVEHLAQQAGISTRQLERLCPTYFGIGPKRLIRVLRLRRCLRRKAEGYSWVNAALEAGYADQSHLSREARSILGSSPTDVMRLWSQGEVFRM